MDGLPKLDSFANISKQFSNIANRASDQVNKVTDIANEASEKINTVSNDLSNKMNPLINMGKTVENISESIKDTSTNITGASVNSLAEQVPDIGALSKDMSIDSTISNATADLKEGINKAKELVSNSDETCAKNAYGHIIHENENDITKTVNKFVNDIFTVDSKIINREDIEKATKEIFFNQLRRSIWEDYHIKHVLVYSMFKKTDNTGKEIISPDFTILGTQLQNAFNGFHDKGATEDNINAVFNKFMTNLNTYVNKKAIKGGKRKIKGGGTNLPIKNPTQQLAMKQKIEKWYSPDANNEKINSDILYIITQAIKNALNEKEARKTIYKNITKVFEDRITKMFDPNFGSDLSLKFYILYNLLLNDEILISTFKRCIRTTLLENNKILESIKRNQSSPPENQSDKHKIDETFILEKFSEQIKKVLFENPTRDPLKDVVNTLQSENTYKPTEENNVKPPSYFNRMPKLFNKESENSVNSSNMSDKSNNNSNDSNEFYGIGGRKRKSSRKTKKNKRTKKSLKKRTIKSKK